MSLNSDYMDISFTFGNYEFHVSSISMGKFERPIPNHSHSSGSYEIHYIASGYGMADINGTEYEITPNVLYITGPHVSHAQYPLIDDPMIEYCLYLKAEKGTSVFAPHAEKTVRLFLDTVFWFGTDIQRVSPVMEELYVESQKKEFGYDTQIESLVRQLIVKLARCYRSSNSALPDSRPFNIIDSQCLIIERCFLDQHTTLTLDSLADQLGLSIRQTERFLLKHYGKTFQQKKTEARMSAASLLLLHSQMSIAEIAEQTGYSCPEHFPTAFKKYFKQTPRNYRNAHTS